MNEYFVNIKVDREERPDVDRMYMTFLQVCLFLSCGAATKLIYRLHQEEEAGQCRSVSHE
jgi:hypothetical protein